MSFSALHLITSRLALRAFRFSDIGPKYLGWLNDPVVTRYSNQRFTTHSLDNCSEYLSSFDGTTNSFLMIELKDVRQPIGTITIYRNDNHGTADIGMMLGDRRCWGFGYGREAWQVVLTMLLSEPDIRKVTGGTARSNHAMVRIMETTGMHLEAVRQRQELIDGFPVDLLYYARFS